jgi:NDP-sugar pyrophosphorylase family protein
MKTGLFCGGLGTRIRGVSQYLPKPMIPIGDIPIPWHVMHYYSQFGHNDFILCLGYKANVIKKTSKLPRYQRIGHIQKLIADGILTDDLRYR